jgi:3-hydroxyisobutyrate dehydrogenase-like beta-hydroxyacid dehydrogenase
VHHSLTRDEIAAQAEEAQRQFLNAPIAEGVVGHAAGRSAGSFGGVLMMAA